MKPNTLKRIDKTLGRIMLVLALPIAFIIDNLVKFLNKRCDKPKKITILKILGGGSLLIAYPSILGLRKRYPNTRIIIICANEVKIYAELTGLFDEIVIISTRSIFSVMKTSIFALLSSFASDIFINYEIHSKLSVIFASLTFSRDRYGLYQDWNSWQERYINHPIFYNSSSPIFIGYEQLAKKTGAEPVEWSEACEHFQNHLKFKRVPPLTGNSELIGVAAFCSDLYKEREFTMEDFVLILSKHISSKESSIVILGSIKDERKADNLANKIRANYPKLSVNNLCGLTTLLDVVKLFENLTVMVSIDSGLNHIARLLCVPTISYWGPSDPFLRLKSLDRNYEKVYFNKLACAPCVHLIDVPPCAGNNICMRQFLEPDLVTISNSGWEIK